MIIFDHIKNSKMYSFNSYSYRRYIRFLSKFKAFARDEQWIEIITLDAIINPKICRYITKIINKLNNNYSIENINNCILNIRNKVEKMAKFIAVCDCEIDEKYFYERELYCYYGLIELIVEGSSITDYLYAKLKRAYGDDYLSVLSKLDKENPSKLNGILKENNLSFECNEINKLYLFLKQWQDKQNTYHKEKIVSTLRELRVKFEKYAVEKYQYLKKYKKQILYSLYFLNKCPILNIDTITKFYHTYVFKYLSSIIGGKNLGLGRLKANNIAIPQTFIIPVGSLENSDYINEIKNLPDTSYAVRSSATVEDGNKHSFAGLFNTELNIQKQNISSTILNVHSSVNSERVVAYVNKFKTEQPHMSIVLQEYIEPQYAGVWMGENLESGHLEYVSGNGEKLVSGKSKPTYEYWENKKQKNLLKFGHCSVGRFFISLQKKLNSIADFEFCIKYDKLIFLQYRPVTKTFAKIKVDANKSQTQVVGIPASCGKISGEPIYLSEKPGSATDLRNKILLADFTDPEWVPALMVVSAIVTAEGGMLCHAAIIARELGIPCVCGVGYESIDLLAQKSKLYIDGCKGIIKFED